MCVGVLYENVATTWPNKRPLALCCCPGVFSFSFSLASSGHWETQLKLSRKVGPTPVEFYSTAYWNKSKADINWEGMTTETQIFAAHGAAVGKF